MSAYASVGSLFLFAFLASFRSYAKQQDPIYIYHFCPNTTTYSKNSNYSSNLRTLLSSLSYISLSLSSGFYNTAAGQNPDVVFGLFLCRGDLSPEVCRICVACSVNDILNRCPNEREAVLIYQECILRYSHENLLSTVAYREGYILSNATISSNQEERFSDLVLSTLNLDASEAANSSIKFYATKANWTSLQTLYVLVQCNPDLMTQHCLSCLQESINRMPLNSVGARVLFPSCNSRYELYSFYNETAVIAPPPPQQASPPPYIFSCVLQ